MGVLSTRSQPPRQSSKAVRLSSILIMGAVGTLPALMISESTFLGEVDRRGSQVWVVLHCSQALAVVRRVTNQSGRKGSERGYNPPQSACPFGDTGGVVSAMPHKRTPHQELFA